MKKTPAEQAESAAPRPPRPPRPPRAPQVQKFRTVETITDLLSSLDQEIADIKDGSMSEPKARVVAKNRQMQLKGFELILTAARIESRFRPEMGKRLGLPPIVETKTPPIQ